MTIGTTAPTFELAGTDGGKYSLAKALERGPVLAAFFKVACPTCQYTFPFLERLCRQFRSAGAADIQVWGISQDGVEPSQRFAKEFGVTFPILLDEEPYELSREYGLKYVPSLFVIAPEGRVEAASEGFNKADLLEIQNVLARRLSTRPPELFAASDHVPEYKPG